MNLEFIKPQNIESLLMKSSQSNFDLRLPSSLLSNYYCTSSFRWTRSYYIYMCTSYCIYTKLIFTVFYKYFFFKEYKFLDWNCCRSCKSLYSQNSWGATDKIIIKFLIFGGNSWVHACYYPRFFCFSSFVTLDKSGNCPKIIISGSFFHMMAIVCNKEWSNCGARGHHKMDILRNGVFCLIKLHAAPSATIKWTFYGMEFSVWSHFTALPTAPPPEVTIIWTFYGTEFSVWSHCLFDGDHSDLFCKRFDK